MPPIDSHQPGSFGWIERGATGQNAAMRLEGSQDGTLFAIFKPARG